jgi:hypothetical protein
MVDFNHPLVGHQVVYRSFSPGSKPEQGTVTSVNAEANIVFVNYGRGSTSQATTADESLTDIKGERVQLCKNS